MINHSTKALDRVIWQYRSSENFKAWIDTLPSVAQTELELPMEEMLNILDVDNESGLFDYKESVYLNVVGAIVGKIRNHILLLDDDVYRVVIKAKIRKNSSTALIDNIKEAIEFITDGIEAEINDKQNMSFSVVFAENLGSSLRTILSTFDLIPRPQGVKVHLSEPAPEEPFFGFSEPYLDDPDDIAGFSEAGDGSGGSLNERIIVGEILV